MEAVPVEAMTEDDSTLTKALEAFRRSKTRSGPRSSTPENQDLAVLAHLEGLEDGEDSIVEDAEEGDGSREEIERENDNGKHSM